MNHRIITAAMLALAPAAQAQFVPRLPPHAPDQQPAPTPTPPPATLDDLLGITPDKPSRAAEPSPAPLDPARAELERKLTPREAADHFKQAVDLMGQTADRLQASKDTGLTTQRLQEDILRRLDMVIHSAQQQQQQSSSRSRQQQNQDQDQQGQQNQERQNASSTPAPDTINPPSRREGPLNPAIAARGQAWGDLPARDRDALLQGNADRYSSLYQQWTEAYYRRLAEEGNK
jgi:hypothetical protein